MRRSRLTMVSGTFTTLHPTCRLFFLALVATLSLFSATVFGGPTDVNDPGIYRKPTTPPLPLAGGVITDPTFGAQILRVTDPTVAPVEMDVNSKPNNSMFNANGTQFYLRQMAPPRDWFLYQIDRATFTVTKIAKLPKTGPDGKAIRTDGAIWHPTNANILFTNQMTTQDRKLWQLDVSSMKMVLLHDFTAELPPGGYAGPIDVDRQVGRYVAMAASTYGGQDDYDYVAVWDRQTDKAVSLNVKGRIGRTLHNIEMDNSGQYIIMGPPGGPFVVWDWQRDTIQQIQNRARGHVMMGNGVMVNHSDGDYIIRSLNTPDQLTVLFPIPKKGGQIDWYEDRHGSRILANNRLFVSHFVANAKRQAADQDWRPLMDEIFEVQIQPDGSASWRRLAHHRMVQLRQGVQIEPDGLATQRGLARQRMFRPRQADFYTIPRANADPTGSFVLFRSNWDSSLPRSDVFLLRVPPKSERK